jgi:hypothetical protein
MFQSALHASKSDMALGSISNSLGVRSVSCGSGMTMPFQRVSSVHSLSQRILLMLWYKYRRPYMHSHTQNHKDIVLVTEGKIEA